MLGALLAVVFMHPSEDLPTQLWRREPALRVARIHLDLPRKHALLDFDGDERARLERQIAAIALDWSYERQGCTKSVREGEDAALWAAELFGELMQPRFASPRAAQWALWRAVALEQHARLFDVDEAVVARAFDDAAARLAAAGDPQAEIAALTAIAHWDAVR